MTTEFCSTRRSANVDIPRSVKFNPPESAKNQFSINRPPNDCNKRIIFEKNHSVSNKTLNYEKNHSIVNKRIGQGNREIVRPSFMSPSIHARVPIDFDKLQAMDISNFGQEVQLGKDQLTQLTMVAVPDPQDTQWIAERNRLMDVFRVQGMNNNQIIRELEANKPLGREQRTINVPSKNIARQQGLDFRTKLIEIKQEIDNGNANSRVQQATLVGQMSVMLQNQDAVRRLTTAELNSINQSLIRLKVPKDYRAVFGGNRVIAGGSNYFKDNKGVIAMFLMSNIPTKRTANQPLLSWNDGQRKYNPSALLQIYQMGGVRYLDMETRTIDTVESLSLKNLSPPDADDASIVPMPGAPDFGIFQ